MARAADQGPGAANVTGPEPKTSTPPDARDHAARRFVTLLFLVITGWILIRLGIGPWVVGAGMAVYLLIVALTVESARKTLAGYAARSAGALQAQSDGVPRDVGRRQEDAHRTFGALGFHFIGRAVRELHPGGPREHVALWTDPSRQILAGLTMYVWRDRMIGDEVRGVATWFEDGRVVTTTNAPDRQAVDPRHDQMCFPSVEDFGILAEIHQRLVSLSDHTTADAETFDPDEAPQAVLERAYQKVREAALANGYLGAGGDGRDAVPTPSGVLRLAIRGLPPIREILRLMERRRGVAALGRMGLARSASRVAWAHWLAAGVGLTALVMGAGAALGVASWATLGIAAAHFLRRRQVRRLTPGIVLAGGAAGVVALLLAIAGGLGMQTGSFWTGALAGSFWVLFDPWGPTLFVFGSAALYSGWIGILERHQWPAGRNRKTPRAGSGQAPGSS